MLNNIFEVWMQLFRLQTDVVNQCRRVIIFLLYQLHMLMLNRCIVLPPFINVRRFS